MVSKFEKVSTRMFCISGVLSDIYCMPDLKLLSFEELLNRRLHELGFRSVVFWSGAKGRFFALDNMGKRGLSCMRKKPERAASAPEAPKTAVRGFGRTVSAPKEKDEGFFIKAAEAQAPEYANLFMSDTTEQKALVFTSLEDFVNNSEASRRSYYAYFEDWRSLPNENRNICIFISKSIDPADLRQIFDGNNTLALRSLFIRGVSSGGAEFNTNSSLIVGSPLGDEIGNLLEYLRIVGYKYAFRDSENNDRSFETRLSFDPRDKMKIVRALSFYNREAQLSELKSIKENIEWYMAEKRLHTVEITPETVPLIYSRSSLSYTDCDDPLELLKNKKGWEPAYEVINSFVLSVRGRKKTAPEPTAHTFGGIERLEPGERSGEDRVRVPNFVLQGPPGVGKTEIANLIGRILCHEGVLRSGHTVTGSRDKLVGQYVGSTAIQTASMIQQAQEGVLLIDEVYNLAEKTDGSVGANYCAEAINTLVAAMTDRNNRFCVIFSGYAGRMDEVWRMNEGLFSRFGESNIINIEGYEPGLLRHIFESSFNEDEPQESGAVLSEEVREGLGVFFENLYSDRDRENFANARDMKELAFAVKRRAGYRYVREELSGEIVVEKKDFGDKEKLFEKRGLSAGDIYASLNDYIGLDFLADMFNDQLSLKTEYEEKGLEYPGPSHMIWCGNPGTGKSTAAQLTAQLYHTLGILGGTEPVYVDASELMSVYMGGGAGKIREKMDEACRYNTILVIEEAYQLTANAGGREIINAMLGRMELDRKRFNVVFILYKSLVEDFLRVNPGMRSRVLIYEFRDYDGEQLTRIFERMCEKARDTYTPEALEKARELFGRLYSAGLTANGNARIVRKLLETMRQRRYKRVTGELAEKMFGTNDTVSRGRVSALRAEKKLGMPEGAYRFEACDIPDGYEKELSPLDDKKAGMKPGEVLGNVGLC